MPAKNLKAVETKLNVKFKDSNFLFVALTHRSYLNEHRDTPEHNERLEFLGDAVLELIITDILYHLMPQTTEGKMTSIRAALVRKENLVKAAETLSLGEHLYLSKGEEQTGGRANSYILANTVEAIIGALYLDQGLESCRTFIESFILPSFNNIMSEHLYRDAKSYLQELSQDRLKLTPTYQILQEEGPDHQKIFTAGVYFDEEQQGTGSGNSKRAAELQAAEDALQKLGWGK